MNYIFADFNGVVYLPDDSEFEYIDLTGYGTIISLNSQQVKLEEGMEFFFDSKDVEVRATTIFDRSSPSFFSANGRWLAKFKPEQIKETDREMDFIDFPCFVCRNQLDIRTQNYLEVCTTCGTQVTHALGDP